MDDLEKIKRKKLLELQRRALERKKLEEQKRKMEELEEKMQNNPRERLLITWMQPDAYQYFGEIRKRDIRVSNLIEEVIQLLVGNGILKERLTYQQLVLIERKITGRGPSIKIKRAGKEAKDLADELRSKL
ncbi:MAG: hypothetical protein ACTSYZ_10205 [Candidatus Helarchaeota archaeon]